MKQAVLVVGSILAGLLAAALLLPMLMLNPVVVLVPGETVIVKVPEFVQVPQLCPSNTAVRNRALDDVPDALVLAYARVFVSEDNCVIWPMGIGSEAYPGCGTGGELSEDARAIVQVTRNIQRQDETELEALARLAKRVAGDAPKLNHRQEWTSTLQGTGLEPPSAWVECEGQKPCDGSWGLYVDAWDALRASTRSYLEAGAPEPPCAGRPLAWGTVKDAEQIAMPRRGFVRYACGQRNWFGGPPDPLAAL